MELAVKPLDQPPRLRPRLGFAREQLKTRRRAAVPLGHDVTEIFRNRISPDDRAMLVGDQHGKGACGVLLEEFSPPFPRLLLDKLDLDAALGKRQADRSGECIEGVVQECRHRPVRWLLKRNCAG